MSCSTCKAQQASVIPAKSKAPTISSVQTRPLATIAGAKVGAVFTTPGEASAANSASVPQASTKPLKPFGGTFGQTITEVECLNGNSDGSGNGTDADDASASCAIPQAEILCKNPNSISSGTSPGKDLDDSFTDAACTDGTEGMTLLGRIGKKLAKFTGDGYIRITKGKAYLDKEIKLKVSNLLHYFIAPEPGAADPYNAILGDPLPAAYDVVADEDGCLYAQKGPTGQDGVKVWNDELQQWQIVSLTELLTNTFCTQGAGIFYGKTQLVDPQPECACPECQDVTECVTGFLPFPESGAAVTLSYDPATGEFTWV